MTEATAAKAERIREQLRQFTGTAAYFQHPLNPLVVYTEGVQFLAEAAEAYWLIDAIASHFVRLHMAEAMRADERLQTLQFWRLEKLDSDVGFDAMISARADGDCEPFLVGYVGSTDFPLDSVDIWVGRDAEGRWVLYLPSEH
ncbi:MAG: hypothetical protein CMJ58_28710 [Planctomycetaceae bacterium]|nr:hypothetical protein [Planctomycetaceae bacterium]